jgi:hypothetical protein
MTAGPTAGIPADVVDRIGRAMTAVLREGWRVNEAQLLASTDAAAVAALVDASLLPLVWLFETMGMLGDDRLPGNIKLLAQRFELLAKATTQPPPVLH